MKSCGVFGPQQPQSKTLTLRQEQVSPAASEWDFLEVIIRHDTVTVVRPDLARYDWPWTNASTCGYPICPIIPCH